MRVQFSHFFYNPFTGYKKLCCLLHLAHRSQNLKEICILMGLIHLVSLISNSLTLFSPGSGKTLLPGGGAIMAPLVFLLWGHQIPKNEPWHIFGPKNYLRSHFEHFQVPLFSRQRAANFNQYYSRKIQNFQNFEFQGCYAPQMKAENMYNSN